MANGDYVDTILDELGKLKPTKLIHISDTHFPIKLRVDRRLDEYQKVIQNTLKEIDRISKENTTICVLTGDIMHDKDRLDPDGILMARKFMISLGKICSRVIVIAGNHDVNEANPEHSTDAVEPICFATPNIEYLKNSGLYRLETLEHEIVFVVSSLLDKKFITYEDARKSSNKRINVMKKVRYIKVYHGAICGARAGKYLIEKKYSSYSTRFRSLDEFKGYDLVLLGDIHKHQFLDEKKTIAYVGSLIQQNFGESIDKHGILVWFFENTQIASEFIEIYNPYCYLKLDVDEKGEIKEPSKNLLRDNQNKNLRLRILMTKKMSQLERDILEKSLDTFNVESITYQHQPGVFQKNSNENTMSTPVFDYLNKELKLMKEMYYKQESPERKILEEMTKLHRKLHSKYNKQGELNSSWCLRKLEFKNILVYGNNIENTVDFNSGVYSISAPNTAGKSSIIEIILLGLFDGGITDKSNVISYGQSEGYIRTEFTANSVSYKVILTLTKIGSKVTRKCTFYEKSETKVENLTLSFSETYKRIKSIIGDCNYFRENNILSTRYQPHLLNIENAGRLARLNKVFNMEKYEQYLNDSELKDHKKQLDGALSKVRTEIGLYDDEIKSINKEQNDMILKTTSQKMENLNRDIELKETEIQNVNTKINETCVNIGAHNNSLSHNNGFSNQNKEQIESRMREIEIKYSNTIRNYNENLLAQQIAKIECSIPYSEELHQKPIQAVIQDLKHQSNCHRELIRRNSSEKPVFKTKLTSSLDEATQNLNTLTLDELKKENTRLNNVNANINDQVEKLCKTCEDVSKWAGVDENTFKKYNISETFPRHLRIKKTLEKVYEERYTMIPENTKSVNELLAWFKKQQPPVYIESEKHAEIINTLEYHENYQVKLEFHKNKKQVEECTDEISDKVKKQNEIDKIMKFLQQKIKWLEEKSKLEIKDAEIESDLMQLKKLDEFNEMKEYYELQKENNRLFFTEKFHHLIKQTEKLKKELKNLEDEKISWLKKKDHVLAEIKNYNRLSSKISECRKKEESTQSELSVYENYMKLFHRDKIPLTMLESMLSVFTRIVNEVFKNHTKYIFKHELNSKTQKLEFNVTDRTTKNKLPTSLLSGFESIILKMAINKACSEISTHSRSRLICVDEALDCLDNQRFDKDLPQIIDAMTQEYQLVLIISHRDLPKGIVSNNIKIIKKEKYSQIDSEQF